METLPIFIPASFIVISLLTAWLFFRATANARAVLVVLGVWMIIQMFIALSDFYLVTDSIPPRFGLAIIPTLVCILVLFATRKGRAFLDHLDISRLTILHVVRIPVELILFGLYIYHMVPKEMTFEGGNLDILSGLSAPIIYFLGFKKKTLGRGWIITWNIICLILLFNIVGRAILSLQTPFQQLGIDQPNRGLLYFPFIWLPSCVVPLVLLSHLATVRKILLGQASH